MTDHLHDVDGMMPVTLEREERQRVLDQARVILKQHYAHLPQKKQLYRIDPVAAIERLEQDVRRGNQAIDEVTFSRRLADVFRSTRDRHLDYMLPYAHGGHVAYLPFEMSEISEGGRRKYIVTGLPEDEPGKCPQLQAEILSWNGMKIEHALADHAQRQPGCSGEARRALAVRTLAMRNLQFDGPPQEASVKVEFSMRGEKPEKLTFKWRVGHADEAAGSQEVDCRLDVVNMNRRALFRRNQKRVDELEFVEEKTAYEKEIRAGSYSLGQRRFGYIRILRFAREAGPCDFANEFVRLLETLPRNGLVIDIRDNPGGSIHIADYLLQTLTRTQIEPPWMQLRDTVGNGKLCSQEIDDDKWQLYRWGPLIKGKPADGNPYSARMELPRESDCRKAPRRHVYRGPVVLVTSALSYSAADFFAAGFQDHSIGPIVGVHSTTGGGGANRSDHGFLHDVLGYPGLPDNVALAFPLLRSARRGRNEGRILEDYGVSIDRENVHERTRNDLFDNDSDLIKKAVSLFQY